MGFDAQIPLKNTYKGVNTIKVTTENGDLEVVFYKIVPKKYIMQKVATVKIEPCLTHHIDKPPIIRHNK